MGSFCPTAVSDFRSIEEDGRVVRGLNEVSAGGLNIKCLETLDVIWSKFDIPKSNTC